MSSCAECGVEYYDERELRKRHYEDNPTHVPDEYEWCPKCENPYKQLSYHWRYNPEHIPELTQKLYEICVGLLMGDGCLDMTSSTPNIKVEMITEKYLKYLKSEFGILGSRNGVYLHRTSEENKESSIHSSKDSEFSNTYAWRTRAHPKLKQFEDWYESGKKVWPENIELTPTVLKHWYVGDGSYTEYNRMTISTGNEVENAEKIDNYFEEVNLPKPKWTENPKNGRMIKHARWTVEESKKLFEYMGSPPPGFDYKWPDS